MAKQRGAKRFFRIGKEDITDPYGTIPAAGYTDPAVTGASKDMRFFKVNEGNFSLKEAPTVEEQQVLQGKLGVAYRAKTGSAVSGDSGVLFHPETLKWFLDAALLRDSTDELHPHTIQEFYPGIDATEKGSSYIGCKTNQLSGTWGTGSPKAAITNSWIGMREEAYTGTIPDVLNDMPTIQAGYFFTNSGLTDVALTGVPALPVADYTDVNFTIANNLEEGPRVFHQTASLRGAISDLIAGQERISGGFTQQWRDLTVLTRFRAFSDLLLRNMFIHPSSSNTETFSGAGTAGTSVLVTTTNDLTLITPVGTVIAIQHGGATPTNWSTAKVEAVTATDVTLEVLDIDIVIGDLIWTEAAEIAFTNINITDLDKTGGPEDAIITLTGTFEGKAASGAGGQVTYKAKDLVLPVT